MRKTRWQQRFENFERAFSLLEAAFNEKEIETYSDLEKEGLIQRFEYTFELAWKTLKDYLEYSGIFLEQITPRNVIKEAFAAKIIQDGQVWIDMLDDRNLLSHTYNPKNFEKAIQAISEKYFKAVAELYRLFKKKDSGL